MRVERLGTESLIRDEKSTVTIGSYDGVHVGHRKILDLVIEGGHSTVVTFHPHPQLVLKNRPDRLELLTPLEEKLRKLEKIGINRVVVVPFTNEFASLSAHDFLHDVLVDKIGLKRIVVGFNHAFGHDRKGTTEYLREQGQHHGFDVVVVDAHTLEGAAVSSTRIRKALRSGDLKTAGSFLGTPYRLIGTVVSGSSRGRKLGFPTANLNPVDPDQLIPAEGVYAIRVHVEGNVYPGVGSIGYSTTFGENPLRIEAHLFDVELDLYGKRIAIELLDYLRPQETYPDADALIRQMEIDRRKAKEAIDAAL